MTVHTPPNTGLSIRFQSTSLYLFKYIENFATKNHILKISPPKTEFSNKNSDFLYISAQNIDCGYSLELPSQGSSNKYPQSMFLSRNKKNNVYPCKPQFYYIEVGFNGIKIISVCFHDVYLE